VQVLDDLVGIPFEPLPSANEQPDAKKKSREAQKDRRQTLRPSSGIIG
jgi:hypothetical protein